MSQISEIAADVYRVSTFIPEANMQFSQFVVRDEEPLLYHTGTRELFPAIRDSLAKLLDPSMIRWIGFSHFEADECGALREWQQVAPRATAICSMVSKMVSVDDVVAVRPARALVDGELLETGKYRFRFVQTPHVPHAWDAGHLFEEVNATLLCSDLFHQNGDLEPITRSDVVGRFREMLLEYQQGSFANYMPYTNRTERILNRLADLRPRTIVPMHGSAFQGNGDQAIHDLAQVMKEVLGGD